MSLADVTLEGNSTTANGGAIWAGFDSQVTVERSTLSGNSAGNVGGALRTLGDLVVVNSTISGNASTGWHGSALFHTDGAARLSSSTVVGNTAPGGDLAALFVGTFSEVGATLELVDNAISGGSGLACIAFFGGSGAVALESSGGNVITDASCAHGADDHVVDDLMLGGLDDNGGRTFTHLPEVGSPVLDAADPVRCPGTDQRGIDRPQGDGCDAGSVERKP